MVKRQYFQKTFEKQQSYHMLVDSEEEDAVGRGHLCLVRVHNFSPTLRRLLSIWLKAKIQLGVLPLQMQCSLSWTNILPGPNHLSSQRMAFHSLFLRRPHEETYVSKWIQQALRPSQLPSLKSTLEHFLRFVCFAYCSLLVCL